MKSHLLEALETVNGLVWGLPTLLLILGVGVLLSLRTGFAQVTLFPAALRSFCRKLTGKDRTSDRRFALSGPVYCISCHCWYGQSGRCGWGYHLRRTGGHFLDVGLRLFRHGHEICRGGPCPALSGPGAGWLCRWPHVHDSEGPGGEMAAHGGGLRSVRRVCRFRRGQRHPNQRLCGWGQ